MKKRIARPKTKTQRRKEDQTNYQARRREERREKEVCVDCGKFPPTDPKSSRCGICKPKRAEQSRAGYLIKKLKEFGIERHEYDLRVQMAGGLCEAHCGNPITHFNKCPQTGELRALVCGSCSRSLDALTGGVAQLVALATYVSNYYPTAPAVLQVERKFLPALQAELARLRGLESERLYTQSLQAVQFAS